jgi:ubiquinone/menaquinone biosynthesis C-methylase UbiE
MRRIALFVLLIGVLALPAAGEDRKTDHDATVTHSFADVERWAERWESPERYEWQKPRTVLRILGIESGQHVADLGCGTGYFINQLSRAVGKTGRVYAVDLEQAMLDHVLAREDVSKQRNVVAVLAEPDDPKLPDGELDLILTVNTWHHIDRRIKYLERLARALKPGGRLVIIDWREGDLPHGPPPGSKLSRDAVVRELDKAGWMLMTESVALPYQYTLVFRVPRP